MLVLSRKLGEKIIIGDNVVLTIVAIKGNQIRVGVEAPRSVSVWRGELLFEQPAAVEKPAAVEQPTAVRRERKRERELVLA